MTTEITALLNIQYPIIQAAMTWLTSATLVAAVSNAGGLGILGPNAGQREKAKTVEDAAEKLRTEIRTVKSLTDKSFGVNFLLPISGNEPSFGYATAILNILIEEKVKIVVVVSYGGGTDYTWINRLKSAGIIILFREISPTVTNSMNAEQMGVNAIIVTGYEAGGHLTQHQTSTLVLLPQVISAVKIPVIAAGGIYNRQTADTMFSMGAQAVYMGTRFINTLENPASDNCKTAIIHAQSEDLTVVRTPFGNARLIAKRDKDGNKHIASEDYIESFRQSMLLGDIENAHICVSESVRGINNIVSCQTLINEIAGIH